MSDTQTKYVNAYIDTAVGTIHEYLATTLQLKTQVKVSNELIREKDELIASLRNQVEDNKKADFEYNKAKDDARKWEEQFNAMRNKVSHMDSLISQITEMKRIINEKDETISNLNKRIEEVINQPANINRKKQKATPKAEVLLVEKTEQPTDLLEINDF
jgi:chromosome segregation ATPase